MGRMYSVSMSAVTVSAAQDLFELLAPATTGFRLHAVFVSQSSDTDSEQLRIRIRRFTGSPSSGTGGGSATPRPMNPGDPASGITAEINNTTQISGGTAVTLHEDSFNVLSGWVFMPTPEMRLAAAPSTYLVIDLPAAPADPLTVNATAYFEELA